MVLLFTAMVCTGILLQVILAGFAASAAATAPSAAEAAQLLCLIFKENRTPAAAASCGTEVVFFPALRQTSPARWQS
jgi:hypothetical protein